MHSEKFERLIRRGLIGARELERVYIFAEDANRPVEDVLLEKGIAKHEVLLCLAGFHNCPSIEYDDGTTIPRGLLPKLDPMELMLESWAPIEINSQKAIVATSAPGPALAEKIKKKLGVSEIEFNAALAPDIKLIIENSYDLNAGFPLPAGRTPLAKVRTYLADRRSMLAAQRTSLARGRTGLSFLRTGISFIAIGVALFRIFGMGWLALLDGFLVIAGSIAIIDGIKWYHPVRKKSRERLDYICPHLPGGVSFLSVTNPGERPDFSRAEAEGGAHKLRSAWDKLAPVERRRFLANDRTDLAEERTALASLRTRMAKARTGLAFARTGVAFAGLGIGLLRQFPRSGWTAFDLALVLAGAIMTGEGLVWYLPGRMAGLEGLRAVMDAEDKKTIWDFLFHPTFKEKLKPLPLKSGQEPGVWATTGLALERTVLADRRNIMARLRTVMARARTAMAFVRTGLAISAVGAGLMIYFGIGNIPWVIFDGALIITGAVLITDGLLWYIAAEKIKSQFPYCFGDLEINLPDYARPVRSWAKAVFSHDDV
jgi:uncharacterized membrane protein YidH (DUF202 family)